MPLIPVPIVFTALPKREINDPRPHCFLPKREINDPRPHCFLGMESPRLVWLISQIVTLAMTTVSDGCLRP